MTRHAWRIAKWTSLTVSAGSVILAVILIGMESPAELTTTETDKEQPQTRVESPVLVERKDGQIVWQLRAAEARQQLDGRMLLSNPRLLLFTKDEREIPIESDKAWLDPVKRNIHFQDNVVIHYESWDLYTETMIYESGTDEMYMPEAFRIQGETLRAHGKDLRLNRQTEQVTVDKGIWIEDSNPQWQGVIP